MSEYTISGREIRSAKGKLVATLDDDGNPVMAPGMAGPHSAKVRAFLGRTTPDNTAEIPAAPEETPVVKENLTTDDPDVPEVEAPEAEGRTNVFVGQIPARRAEGGVPEETPRQPETLDEYSISTIPDDELPPFSSEYGIFTPGFLDFCEKHKLTAPQRAALVARLQNKMKGKQNA